MATPASTGFVSISFVSEALPPAEGGLLCLFFFSLVVALVFPAGFRAIYFAEGVDVDQATLSCSRTAIIKHFTGSAREETRACTSCCCLPLGWMNDDGGLFLDRWCYVTSCWDMVPEEVVHIGSSRQVSFHWWSGEGGSDDASTNDGLFLL